MVLSENLVNQDILQKPLKVSVCVVTYNQEKYIAQCLQSIVDQETDFNFEVIVADDCSMDGTREIVQDFAEKYPSVIKPIIHKKNIGAYKNFLFVHEKAAGEYVAHIDGDDYALPGKLQAQANYLDENPECNIVWHRMLVKNESTGIVAEDLMDISKLPADGFKRSDILRFISVGFNSSKMYRASEGNFEVPEFPIVDYLANVEQVGLGYAHFVGDRPLGTYRAEIGIASSSSETKFILKKTFSYFLLKYPQYKREIATAALILFLSALKNGKWSDCRLFVGVLTKTLGVGSVLDIFRYKQIFRMLRLPSSVRKFER